MSTRHRYEIRNLRELRAAFWSDLRITAPELAALRRTRKVQNDYPTDVRVQWVDYVDTCARNHMISDSLASRATL